MRQMNATETFLFSLDHLANNIASATFDVINAGKVRTADMGGESPFLISRITKRAGSSGAASHSGSATTSEFTAAVIKNLN